MAFSKILLSMFADKQTLYDKNYHTVFVYKADELSLLSKERVAKSICKYPEVRMVSVYRLLTRILFMAGFNDAKYEDVVNIEDAKNHRFASKYKALEDFYRRIADDARRIDTFISDELLERCGMSDEAEEIRRALLTYQKNIDKGWIDVQESLFLVTETWTNLFNTQKLGNIVLCDEGIAHGASKMLIAGYSAEIPIQNIYSTANVSTESILERIQRRFGENCNIVVVTLDKKTASSAEKHPEVRMTLVYQLLTRLLHLAGFNDAKYEDVVNMEDVENSRIFQKYEALEEWYEKTFRFFEDANLRRELLKTCGMSEQADEIYEALCEYRVDIHYYWETTWNSLMTVCDTSFDALMYTNVVLCEDGIAHAVAQLSVSELSTVVDFDKIYSTAFESTESVLERIRQKYGEKCTVNVITDDPDLTSAAEKVKCKLHSLKDFLAMNGWQLEAFVHELLPNV